jgi:PHD/YefM family antitoxin component YafN of YafNO toxin-antitoxin module
MNRVTSVEFQREFGRMRNLGQREPIMVTDHGREDLVILSAHEYNRLKHRDRQAIRAADTPDNDLALLNSAQISTEARAFDHEVE